MNYENIIIERHDAVAVIKINRPQAMNALSAELMREISTVLADFDSDDSVRAIVLTGDERAFAAGADIGEMADRSFVDMYTGDFISEHWESIDRCEKPIIAAVGGFALGGGCEIALMCDLIIAAETAQFGQPEIRLGVIPGAGGTQRLARFIGKSKTMDLCLTGRMMDAQEAERCGLVSRIVTADKLLEEAIAAAGQIAQFSQPATKIAKEVIKQAFEVGLNDGVRLERRLFQALFSTEDQKEGMQAFLEKRAAKFKDK